VVDSGEREFALSVVRDLRGAGFEAYWAGGCVRDLLMGNQPTDYDVATSATPQQVRELFGRRRTLPVGVTFGVMIVVGPNAAAGQVEVATFRTDATYSDGRHPDAVTFSTPHEDAQRRDFTINGMFYDPLLEQVFDYVGGQSDLQAGLIRAIGCAADRLAEDKLRMLRAVRFAARFGFSIETDTGLAIQRHAPEIALVSGERTWMEIRKTLESPRASLGVQHWAKLGLLESILPEIAGQWDSAGDGALRLLGACHDFDWLTRFCCLLWPFVGSEATAVASAIRSLKTRLKLSNDLVDALRFSLTCQPVFSAAPQHAWSAVQPLLISPWARQGVEICTAKQRIADAPHEAEALQRSVDYLNQKLASERIVLDPPPLLVGEDLMAAGLRPGPQFKHLLEQVRCYQLDQRLLDRQAALEWLQQQIDS
jgi:poly(A) polymerase